MSHALRAPRPVESPRRAVSRPLSVVLIGVLAMAGPVLVGSSAQADPATVTAAVDLESNSPGLEYVYNTAPVDIDVDWGDTLVVTAPNDFWTLGPAADWAPGDRHYVVRITSGAAFVEIPGVSSSSDGTALTIALPSPPPQAYSVADGTSPIAQPDWNGSPAEMLISFTEDYTDPFTMTSEISSVLHFGATDVPPTDPGDPPTTTDPPATGGTTPPLAGTGAGPAAVGSSSSSPAAGSAVVVAASGFLPNEPIDIVLHSTPVTLYTGNASATGAVSQKVTIPVGTAPGAHRIEIRGATSGSVWFDITVPRSLASTGLDATAPVGIAGGALLLGALVLGGLTAARAAGRRAGCSG